MKYDTIIGKTFYELGIHKKYKGSRYTLSCIEYIDQHSEDYRPVTKLLYVDVAKMHNTSDTNIEKGIRSIIDMIWNFEDNKEFIEKIFGKCHVKNKPANTEFLELLHAYAKAQLEENDRSSADFGFICPISKTKCPFHACGR